jgi:hypothetical protein
MSEEHEGEQVGRAFGYAEDEEATSYPMTPKEGRRWHNIRQATPSLAYTLMGIFDGVNPEPETEFSDEWF